MKIAALILILIFVLPLSAAQNAMVITDGAMVYKKGDFDAPVIGYLSAGKKVRISSKKFGPFYRIQFKQGVIGYISDIDVDVGAKGLPTSKKSSKGEKSPSRVQSFIGKTYLGVSFAKLNFSEEVSSTKTVESESLGFFGLKLTMPLKVLAGPFVFDTNLLYHNGYPGYYDEIAKGQSGKILMYDAQILYSLAEGTKRTFWAYVGGGLAFSYSSFVIECTTGTCAGSRQDLSDMLFGGVIGGGFAVQTGKFAIKLEPKYYVMKSNYLAIVGSVQYEF